MCKCTIKCRHRTTAAQLIIQSVGSHYRITSQQPARKLASSHASAADHRMQAFAGARSHATRLSLITCIAWRFWSVWRIADDRTRCVRARTRKLTNPACPAATARDSRDSREFYAPSNALARMHYVFIKRRVSDDATLTGWISATARAPSSHRRHSRRTRLMLGAWHAHI